MVNVACLYARRREGETTKKKKEIEHFRNVKRAAEPTEKRKGPLPAKRRTKLILRPDRLPSVEGTKDATKKELTKQGESFLSRNQPGKKQMGRRMSTEGERSQPKSGRRNKSRNNKDYWFKVLNPTTKKGKVGEGG